MPISDIDQVFGGISVKGNCQRSGYAPAWEHLLWAQSCGHEGVSKRVATSNNRLLRAGTWLLFDGVGL